MADGYGSLPADEAVLTARFERRFHPSDEKVSVEAARERYGVVIVAGRVDEQATVAARRA